MIPPVHHAMTCEDVEHVLWLFLDDELDAPRRESVRRHLAECDACRGYFSFHRVFRRDIARVSQPIDVEALRARIVRALEAEGYVDPSSHSIPSKR